MGLLVGWNEVMVLPMLWDHGQISCIIDRMTQIVSELSHRNINDVRQTLVSLLIDDVNTVE